MSFRHRSPELEASIDPVALRAAADEHSDLLLTLCLCMKMVGPTRANAHTYASELKKHLITRHSRKELSMILSSWDPVGYVPSFRREANDNARAAGNPANVSV